MSLVFWIGVVGVGSSLLGLELTLQPPKSKIAKWVYRTGFILLGLIGLILAICQSRLQDKRETKTDSSLGRIESYTVSIYSNFSLMASAAAVANAHSELPAGKMLGKLQEISEKDESFIIAKLSETDPLDTQIWLTTSQIGAQRLALLIQVLLQQGGYTTTRIVTNVPGGELMFPNTLSAGSWLQVSSKELPEPSVVAALLTLLGAVGAKQELWASQATPGQLIIVVRDQPQLLVPATVPR